MITGRKTLLRAIERSDIIKIRDWNYGPQASDVYNSRFPISEQEQYNWFHRQRKDASKKKFMILVKKNRKPIGMLGLMDIDQINKCCEIGILIGEKEYLGKGYAQDAMQAMLEFLFQEMNFNCVYLYVFQTNKKAIQFFKRVGFKKDGVLRECVFKQGKYISKVIMSILKKEFLR
jgi:UDP-4-amino-4,6-dideoxy-N-acetyl-beta-L-altrosamine N-acetyltransferase